MIEKKNFKIANFEWTSGYGRDRTPSTLLTNYLRLHGYDPKEFSIFDAYHIIHRWRPDLIFMQCTTGARENVEVAEYIKSNYEYASIPVILISPSNSIVSVKMEDEIFYDEYIQKPVLFINLLEKVHNLLSKKLQPLGH